MLNARVLPAYIFFVALNAIIPWLVVQFWWVAVAGAIYGVLWWIVIGIWGDTILLKTLGAEPLNVSKYHEVAIYVKEQRCGPGLGPPTPWQVNNFSAMVLTVGLRRPKSHIIFTTGFFDKLEDKAQIGLIARETESIREGLTSANSALACLIWIILLPGRIVTVLTGRKYGEPNIPSMIVNIVPAFVVGMPIGLIGADKSLCVKVDSASLKNVQNPDYIPYGLMKLQESILSAPFDCDLALSGCCIINPNNRDALQLLFKLHPPTPKRIDRLRIRAKSSRRAFNR